MKKVWRFDNQEFELKCVEYSINVQLDRWQANWHGDGWYIYSENFESIKQIAIEEIDERLLSLQEKRQQLIDMKVVE